MNLLVERGHSEGIPLTRRCDVLGVNRSTIYSRRSSRLSEEQRAANQSRKNSPQPRALSEEQRQSVRDILYCAEFGDQPPTEIYHTLLDEARIPVHQVRCTEFFAQRNTVEKGANNAPHSRIQSQGYLPNSLTRSGLGTAANWLLWKKRNI